MRIVNVIQGSEEWEALRCGIPTASNFSRFITPAKAQLSASWKTHAIELLAEEAGGASPAMMPSFWMDHGKEMEPYAIAAYEKMTGRKVTKVGFVWPDDHSRYGCSPDGLVNPHGLLEVKCPKPEVVLAYHDAKELPLEYKPQVMGQLWITNREWCDFIAYHPKWKPFLIRVERDEKYIANLAVALEEFCDNLESLKETMQGLDEAVDVAITDDYQPMTYESTEGEI